MEGREREKGAEAYGIIWGERGGSESNFGCMRGGPNGAAGGMEIRLSAENFRQLPPPPPPLVLPREKIKIRLISRRQSRFHQYFKRIVTK